MRGTGRVRSGTAVSRAAVLVALGIGGCRGGDGGGSPSGGVAVVCSQAQPSSLDPFSAPDQLSSDFRLVLYTPLVLYDGKGGFRPYLARSWDWGEGQRSLTFHLRGDVLWHDSTRVTASDVAWTIRAAAEPRYAYTGGADFDAVSDVQVVDSQTVRLDFDRRYAPGLEPFVALPVLPQHLLDSIPPEEFAKADYNRGPVGSGPFRFAGRDPDGTLRFTRFDAFPEDLGRPSLDGLVFRNVADAATLLVELRTRGVDACITGSSLAKDLAQDSTLTALRLPPVGVQVIPLNGTRKPFDDPRVRRAFSAALDRAQLAGLISPLASPAATFLPEGHAAIDPAFGQPDADTALAAALLDSAGWSRGPDGVRRNARGEPLRVDLVGPQPFADVMTAVQAQLSRVGFDAKLQLLEGGAFYQVIMDPKTRPAAMALTFRPDRIINPDPTAELHTGGDANLAGYSNATVDSLLGALPTAASEAARDSIYRALQRWVALDVPLVYTDYVPRLLAVGPRLSGVSVDANGPFASISEWRVTGRAGN